MSAIIIMTAIFVAIIDIEHIAINTAVKTVIIGVGIGTDLWRDSDITTRIIGLIIVNGDIIHKYHERY